jgi:hypothetical protein
MPYISNDMINTDNNPFFRPIILFVANKAIKTIVHFISLSAPFALAVEGHDIGSH